MRIALAGARTFAIEVLKMLQEQQMDVVLVACEQTDKLWETAAESGVRDIRTELVPGDIIRNDVDLIVGAHYKRWIDASVIEASRWGAIGYHPSLLPRHRGGDAVRWTIHMGDPIAGGTVYRMEGGADTGPIIAQDWCHVVPGWTASDLWREELFGMGIRLLRRVVGWAEEWELSLPDMFLEQDERVATWEPTFDRAPLSEVASHGR